MQDFLNGLDPADLVEFSKVLNGRMRPVEQAVADHFTAAARLAPIRRDPLTLDLDGDGLETVGTAAGILFDQTGSGVRQGTGWVAPDDGFLVLDRNGDGVIDSGRELFGDSTHKSTGQTALDGFDALRDLDSNADGKISSTDAQFGNLRVWRDHNQDGISQAGELSTLASNAITAIGAAIASNCEPCFRFHYDKARKLGVSKEDMARAVATARMVKEAPARAVLELAGKYLGGALEAAEAPSSCCPPAETAPVALGKPGGAPRKCC